ncbi:NAD(P)H-dependent flavin oxidoreductase [Candidatus Binatus sp.]|uniref:NAD(P)H-dependent flavin oxidoreductase n=1 Tax=Candidatus Binatus sp. TaxID=2811406 RepID=UPI002F91C306
MFHTAICDLLGIRYPIIQGAMQDAGGPRLVAAVSEAGGLGVLPTFGGTEAALRADIEKTSKLTRRPFAVNITPIGRAFTESRAAICIEMGVKIVTTGRGDPGLSIVEKMKAAGIVVIPVVPSVAHAIRVEQEGADAIVASGSEAGGHVGRVSTMPLVPQVVDAVKVPVVAAGGIGDGRGFLAALALGACGIQLGTRFIAAQESEASDWVKQRIIAARETDTIVSSLMTGKPVRALSSRILSAYEAERARCSDEQERAAARGRFLSELRDAARDDRTYAAGEISGMIRGIAPVRDLIEAIINDAAALAEKLHALAGRS